MTRALILGCLAAGLTIIGSPGPGVGFCEEDGNGWPAGPGPVTITVHSGDARSSSVLCRYQIPKAEMPDPAVLDMGKLCECPEQGRPVS